MDTVSSNSGGGGVCFCITYSFGNIIQFPWLIVCLECYLWLRQWLLWSHNSLNVTCKLNTLYTWACVYRTMIQNRWELDKPFAQGINFRFYFLYHGYCSWISSDDLHFQRTRNVFFNPCMPTVVNSSTFLIERVHLSFRGRSASSHSIRSRNIAKGRWIESHLIQGVSASALPLVLEITLCFQ